jgi:hypothetical protein
MRSNTSSELGRATEGYIWVNNFFPGQDVALTIYAPPRTAPNAELLINNHEFGYFNNHNMLIFSQVVDEGVSLQIHGPGGPIDRNSFGQWMYPGDEGDASDLSEYEDLWVMAWRPL